MSSSQDVPENEAADARPRLSRRGWILVIAGLTVLTVVAGWVGLQMASQPVRWQDVGFEVHSSTESEITFDVYLYTDEPVVCYVQALTVQYAEVGVGEVTVDPADGSQQRITLDIPTVEQATAATVRGCAPQ